LVEFLDLRRLGDVVLVLDVADDHFHDVFDGDESVGAAIFVDHQRRCVRVVCMRISRSRRAWSAARRARA